MRPIQSERAYDAIKNLQLLEVNNLLAAMERKHGIKNTRNQ